MTPHFLHLVGLDGASSRSKGLRPTWNRGYARSTSHWHDEIQWVESSCGHTGPQLGDLRRSCRSFVGLTLPPETSKVISAANRGSDLANCSRLRVIREENLNSGTSLLESQQTSADSLGLAMKSGVPQKIPPCSLAISSANMNAYTQRLLGTVVFCSKSQSLRCLLLRQIENQAHEGPQHSPSDINGLRFRSSLLLPQDRYRNSRVVANVGWVFAGRLGPRS